MYRPPFVVNNSSVSQSSSENHLNVMLNIKLMFEKKTSKIGIFENKDNLRTTPKITKPATNISTIL